MGILLYCIAKSDGQPNNLLMGVSGLPVVRVESGELAAFTSNVEDSADWLTQKLQVAAVEFHRVVSEVFKSKAIIPFRFPTIFRRDLELSQHLQEHASRYSSLLEKFADSVQMEIRVMSTISRISTGSGTDYLKQKQSALRAVEELAAALERRLSPLVRDWRKRASKEGSRVFALVARGEVKQFEAAMREVAVTNELQVRVSGPWPVSEFIDQS